ncbi:MAG: FAD/NAD(P)-binding oxidoreductase [bacterium]
MPAGVQWIKQAVQAIEPEQKTLRLGNGEAVTYDILVVCPGIQLRIDEVPGLRRRSIPTTGSGPTRPALCREGAAGHRGLQGQPRPLHLSSRPSSAAAPQKIMWIAEEWMRKNGVRTRARCSSSRRGPASSASPATRRP